MDLFSTLAGTGSRPLPVIQRLEFRPGADPVSAAVRLPIAGEAIRYPFDTWTVTLRVVPLSVLSDGATQAPAAGDAAGLIALSVDNRIPRLDMHRGVIREGGSANPSQSAALDVTLLFERPLYPKIVTVLLVAAASAYVVFLRPLDELIINAGALVLGVWGIRAVLLGTDLTFMTGVGLALMGVILFLLGMLTARTLWVQELRRRLQVPRGVARWWRHRAR